MENDKHSCGPPVLKSSRQSSLLPAKQRKCIFCNKITNVKDLKAAAAVRNFKVNSKEDRAYVLEKTLDWRNLGSDLNHPNLIAAIGTIHNPVSDLRAAEVFYELKCYSQAVRKQKQIMKPKETIKYDTQILESFALRHIVRYINDHFQQNPKIPLKLSKLAELYQRVLQRYHITYNYKFSTFLELLKLEFPDLKSFSSGGGKTFT